MKIIPAILLGCAGLAAPVWAEDLKTLNGETYSNVVVRQFDNTGLYIRYDGGTTQVPFAEISAELRGHYKSLSLEPLPMSKLAGAKEAPAGPNDLVTLAGKIYRNVVVKKVEADSMRIAHDTGMETVSFSAIPRDLQTKYRNGPVSPDPTPGANDLVTTYGQVFRSFEVIQDEPDGLTFRHAGGVTKLGFPSLPDELKQKYNYDPQVAWKYSRDKAAARLAAQTATPIAGESGGPPTLTVYSIETDALEDNKYWIRFSVKNLTEETLNVQVVPCEGKLAEITRGKGLEIPPHGDVKLQQIVVPEIKPVYLVAHGGGYTTNSLLAW